ncbi:MAG: hypothetical protein AB7F22_10575 [Reyranella sp.]|uniref:hypothetical protein n=1 Tax=Reyranella sp. TaxID=1929291 RepID=UPI003D115133
MLTVVAPLWDANAESFGFSRCYNEAWVERLYRGFARNLTRPFRFVCFTDRLRTFAHPEIGQERFAAAAPTYRDGVELYRLSGPLLVLGLDTVIVGNIDHLADWCETTDRLGLPRDPFNPGRACNGIALAPREHGHVLADWDGEDDMAAVRKHPHVYIDDLWPGQVISFKGAGQPEALGPDVRIVYFHGRPKPHDLTHLAWVREAWR